MGGCESIEDVFVYERTASRLHQGGGPRHDLLPSCWPARATECPPVAVDAEHPLFILYTSGSTGKPKGVQHSTGGYMLWAKPDHAIGRLTCRHSDVFWCTADIGWITGHTYVAYGPLAAGATQIVFEGVPTYPNAGRFWQMIERHKLHHFLHRADGHPLADQGLGSRRDGAPQAL